MELKKRVVIWFGGFRVAEFDDFKDIWVIKAQRVGNEIHCIAHGKDGHCYTTITGIDKEKES